MRVIVTRHGQTNENVQGVTIGHEAQVILNEQGILQAKKLGHFLKHEKIHAAYVSPQERAVHTAKEILTFHPHVAMVTVPQLKEQHLGIYEGKGKAEWKAIKTNYSGPFHAFKPPEGESYLELQERVKSFFHGLLEKHQNDTVLLVSHAGTLGMLYLHLLNKEMTEENYKAHKPENTALTIFDIFPQKPVHIHHFNSTHHLNG